MVGTGAEDDHRAAAGVLRVLGELSADALGHGRGHAGDLLLPRGRVRLGVVISGRPLPWQALARDPVLREQQVEDRGHGARAATGLQRCGRDPASVHPAALAAALPHVEAREEHLCCPGVGRTVEGQSGVDALEVEVPLALAGVVEPKSEGTVRHMRAPCRGIDEHRLEGRALRVVAEVGRRDELVGHPCPVLFLEAHEEREVGVLLDVLDEPWHLPIDEELGEDDVAHGHGERTVGAGMRRHPFIGELRVVGVVGRDGDDLLAAVAGLGHEVGIRRSGDGHVGAPHDEVRGVPPVGRLGHVGLVAEHLRRGDGQVGVPVVEREHRAAEQADEPRTRGMRCHRHRRDRRESEDPIGTVFLDGVDVCCSDELVDLGPGGAHEPALAARPLVAAACLGVAYDGRPGIDRVVVHLPCRSVGLEQDPPDVGVPNPGGRVGVPRERGSSRATARLVFGAVGAYGRVVGLLRFPGDDAVLDIHLPRARPGAVHSVRAAHHLVVAPAVAVEGVALAAADLGDGAQVLRHLARGEEPSGPDQELLSCIGTY
ncbi:unannotated protein [freshwater metagenome]|uniref:Unannotated protein n=1 Tax=freshwater metagenome TaxID=449393 RepID=A0A6J7LB96_9ZZZZ